MYSYFSELHVDLLSRALLEPGEQRLGQSVGRYMPWWGLGFINETYLIIATDRRVILVEHRMAWLHQATKLHGVESLPWAGVQEARVTGIFGKKLRVRGQGQSRAFARKLRIPSPLFGLLAPIRNNVDGARAVAKAFQVTRGLSAAPAYAALPAMPAHLTPPMTAYDAQPMAALPAPAALPAQNAPGYSSVPPESAYPQAAPQYAAPPYPGAPPMRPPTPSASVYPSAIVPTPPRGPASRRPE
jgi:hypothetical protein